ncbi:squalene-associated FAD-dependent desaturase [Jatrophihabitans endophyticus]|uniref:Squalene-associated FAD-dependent desaturase n=1 Tax=Jatrophihabitans endophyticus TaxID=1206085 RepID=A0A1M5M9B1_9ACTN|nr:hydroxysqualene dehydroxylase HpnE [Jatrophihabitans endophyticus]SHG73805.1 squalene-associated FAD-dependent desaturase [Jatrophihabitans endophyticus]
MTGTDTETDTETDTDGRVVVVGGGLAGIAAALHCADAGRPVTLYESRPRLGGMAFSFTRDGLSVDNGQHVFLRCCDAYRGLLDRLGVTERTTLQRRLDIAVLRPDGRSARLRRTAGVPAPAHLTPALLRYGLLSPVDRARAARAAVALRLLDAADPRLDARTLGDFLRHHGQNRATVDALWGVLATATLNLPPDDASLALAAKVFRTGVLDRAAAGDVGHAVAPLGDLHSIAARRALTAAGVDVRLAHHVTAVRAGAGPLAVTVRVRGTETTVHPASVVLAVPPRVACRTAPELAAVPAGRCARLGTSPIVNVHVHYDRRVTDLPFAAAVDSPVQWFFDRTESSGLAARRPGAQYLAVTVSAADDIIDTTSPVLQQRFVAELARLLPGAEQADVLDVFVTRERHATFRQSRGSGALRPTADSGLPGVWLAGAWTDTGWPDTMEGAVRSGITAARAVSEPTAAETMGNLA